MLNLQAVCKGLEHSHPIQPGINYQQLDCLGCSLRQIYGWQIHHDHHPNCNMHKLETRLPLIGININTYVFESLGTLKSILPGCL